VKVYVRELSAAFFGIFTVSLREPLEQSNVFGRPPIDGDTLSVHDFACFVVAFNTTFPPAPVVAAGDTPNEEIASELAEAGAAKQIVTARLAVNTTALRAPRMVDSLPPATDPKGSRGRGHPLRHDESMRTSPSGKVVVITGGARGIGFATARAFQACGARVVIGDLDEHGSRRAAKEIGPSVVGLHLDVTDHAGYTAFLDEVEREVGPIDVLINNAGIMPLAMLDEESDEATYRQLEINLAAVIHGTREAIKRMKPRGQGHIVNIASVAGKVGAAGAATYCATKFGVVGLSEAVRSELRGSGVEISCVMPTIARTELAAGLSQTKLSSQVAPEQVAAAIVAAVEHPRFEVWVPAHLGRIDRILRIFPRALGELILRIGGSDRLLAEAVDSPARADYEARAAAGAPTSVQG
jgi:NAD(P)-dependent dehydrogenase (short-subunit alcohol dehydrogenase family)